MERQYEKKQKDRSKQLRGRRVARIAVWGVCVYFLVSIITCQVSIYKEKRRLAELEAEIVEQQLANDDLQRIIVSSDGTQYVERLAREKLGYAAINERVFVDVSGSQGGA